MRKQTFLCLPLFFLPIGAYALTYYSKINSKALVEGTDDCWIINYSVWHDNSTVHNPTDDVLIGTRNTIVGTDCNPDPLAESDPNDVPVEIAPNSDLILYPNPAKDQLTIRSTSKNSHPVSHSWTIQSMTDGVSMAGFLDSEGQVTIPITSLKPGQYILTLRRDPLPPLQRQFLIIR